MYLISFPSLSNDSKLWPQSLKLEEQQQTFTNFVYLHIFTHRRFVLTLDLSNRHINFFSSSIFVKNFDFST